jgi:DNA-binding response OmpR family regulator
VRVLVVEDEVGLAEALERGLTASGFTVEVTHDGLVSRLRALHRRGTAPRPPVLEVGDLVLDPASRECRRDGTPIALTAREFDLLEALARRPGAVRSKVDLLDSVWGSDFEGDSNVVEVYVGYLRRKIDAPFGRRSLQTVRGMGYRVIADV